MALTESARLKLLAPPVGRVRVVLDTDTYNEIDDQFALVQLLLSKDRFECHRWANGRGYSFLIVR